MNYIFFSSGVLDWGTYLSLMLLAVASFVSLRGFSWWNVTKGVALVSVLQFTPVIFCGGLALLLVVWSVGAQNKNDMPNPACIKYTYDFFGDNDFTGYCLNEYSSYLPLGSNSAKIPDAMRKAVQRARSIDPYQARGVVVSVEVVNEGGKPVIYDHIVTNEQINRRNEQGMWDTPQDYNKNKAHINGQVEADEEGNVHLPAPTGLAAMFMSQINGPKTKRIRRR